MLVAIHQPIFFPWLGYFDKIARSDVFVVLDHVQFPRTGSGTWLNRVKWLVGGEARWFTAPVAKGLGLPAIRGIEFAAEPWRQKGLATLDSSYRRAPFYDEARSLIQPLLEAPVTSLSDYNFNAVARLAKAFGLDSDRIVRSSELDVDGASTDLLVSIVKAVGGTAYLAGGGASGYQEDEKFNENGLVLTYQNFVHPAYPQHGSRGAFVPGLSVIDALMNLGIDGTASMLRRGSA